MDEPLAKRKKLLGKTVRENQYLAVSRFIEEKGSAFYRLAEQNNLEGIVAKRKNSKYRPATRTKDWVKIKFLQMMILWSADISENRILYQALSWASTAAANWSI